MSATLDAAPVAAYLGAARVIRNEGRQYPLEIEYTPHSAAPVEERVAGALDRLASRGHAGMCWRFCRSGRDPSGANGVRVIARRQGGRCFRGTATIVGGAGCAVATAAETKVILRPTWRKADHD